MPCWVGVVDRVIVAVGISVKALGIVGLTNYRIRAYKSTQLRVVVSGSVEHQACKFRQLAKFIPSRMLS